jgi:hypothetical protein
MDLQVLTCDTNSQIESFKKEKKMNRRQFISTAVSASLYSGLHPIFAQDHSADNIGQIRQWKGKPIRVKNRKQLFIDNKFIDYSKGITLQMNRPQCRERIEQPKVSGIIKSPGQWGVSVIKHDGKYWLYQQAQPDKSSKNKKTKSCWTMCISQSKDGLNWEDPNVGRFRIQGSRSNNVVMAGAVGTVFLDPLKSKNSPFWFIGNMRERDTAPFWHGNNGTVYRTYFDKERQYHHEGGVYLAHSVDGIYWKRLPGVALPFWCDTSNQCFYDNRIKKYVAYLRGNNPTNMPKRRNVRRAVTDSLTDIPWPYDENPERKRGLNGLYGDLIDELPEVMRPDAIDPVATDIYNPSVNIYPWAEDVYLAFPSVYRHYDGQNTYGWDLRGKYGNSGSKSAQLAVSRDGIHFHRFRYPYISPGLLSEPLQGGTISVGIGLLRQGHKIYQYYTEHPYPHGEPTHIHQGSVKVTNPQATLYRTEHRLDGFVSADAGPTGGELITPPITFQGNRLLLNIDCGALGEAWVEIQDPHGRSLPGYGMDQAVSVDRNGIAQEVWWKDGPDVSSLSGKPVRLNIKMRSAKLYAFRFSG